MCVHKLGHGKILLQLFTSSDCGIFGPPLPIHMSPAYTNSVHFPIFHYWINGRICAMRILCPWVFSRLVTQAYKTMVGNCSCNRPEGICPNCCSLEILFVCWLDRNQKHCSSVGVVWLGIGKIKCLRTEDDSNQTDCNEIVPVVRH